MSVVFVTLFVTVVITVSITVWFVTVVCETSVFEIVRFTNGGDGAFPVLFSSVFRSPSSLKRLSSGERESLPPVETSV
jgi:hypothetical protein